MLSGAWPRGKHWTKSRSPLQLRSQNTTFSNPGKLSMVSGNRASPGTESGVPYQRRRSSWSPLQAEERLDFPSKTPRSSGADRRRGGPQQSAAALIVRGGGRAQRLRHVLAPTPLVSAAGGPSWAVCSRRDGRSSLHTADHPFGVALCLGERLLCPPARPSQFHRNCLLHPPLGDPGTWRSWPSPRPPTPDPRPPTPPSPPPRSLVNS